MTHPHPHACALVQAPKRCDRPGDDDRFRGVRRVPSRTLEDPLGHPYFGGALSSQRLTSVTPVMAAARTVIRAPIYARQSCLPMTSFLAPGSGPGATLVASPSYLLQTE